MKTQDRHNQNHRAQTHPARDHQTQKFEAPEFSIELNCRGNSDYTKVSYPVKYGIFSRLESRDHVFEFNLNHEIRHAKSKSRAWIHPSEWLKRTMGNDWVYYSTGGYSGVKEALGEYYLPNLMYPTNSLLGGKPFDEPVIKGIVNHWHEIIARVSTTHLPDPFAQWMQAVRAQTPEGLEKKARALFDISGSRVTVMPPDARHVDYNIIPLNISDGCLYKCRFCKVKNKKKFSIRPAMDIDDQIRRLKTWFGRDMVNFNALFLGEHDALGAPGELILDTARTAARAFGFHASTMEKKILFLFGCADSFLDKDTAFFKALDGSGFHSFINIGLESCDQATLDLLGKPLTPQKVTRAFEKVQAVNDTCSNLEITCNFVMDEALPDSHHHALMSLIREGGTKPKGTLYISPLKFGSPSRQVLYDFYRLKSASRFPTFLYLIQRL